MNLRQIEVFRAIMQTGSFTGAADMLHISQPGVSRAVRHLEIQLGVTLFERAQGRIRPSSEALALHAEIERSYRGVQAIQQFAQNLRNGTHSMLRIACSPNTGFQAVPRAVASFLETHAGSTVSLEVLPRAQQMIDALLSQQIDLGISSVGLEHPMLEAKAVGQWELVCLFPRNHRFSSRKSVSIGDLRGEPLISFQDDTLQGRIVAEWLRRTPHSLTPRALVRSGQSAASLVVAGVGPALVDNLTAVAAQSQGLEWRPLRHTRRLAIHAVWNKHHTPSRHAMQLCDLVRAELARIEAM